MDEKGCEQKFRLVDRVSHKWQEFGLLLGVTMNNLNAWESEHRRNAATCWGEVMKFWLTGGVGGGEYPITWDILLSNAQLSEVAKGLEIAVSAAVNS